MTDKQIIKDILKNHAHMSERQLGRITGRAATSMSTILGNRASTGKSLTVSVFLEFCQVLGYELVCRPIKMGRPSSDEYIVTMPEDKPKKKIKSPEKE